MVVAHATYIVPGIGLKICPQRGQELSPLTMLQMWVYASAYRLLDHGAKKQE